ncbi:helix-turn-helix domain-containing protein [Aeromicrobium massiliense]|uniref:helix-turn-helix domain-containing protein n=1 Tax=Aeromicrobium massiliense TaxID=1464554 RepID=UPI00031D8D95|nr:XRE family transcriptional regulator [Aeromicrobium massiliense]
MDSSATELARLIGDRVRDARAAQGWTLDRLAEMTGLSRRALVNVEQGATNPSVATLLALSDALGIGLPSLVEPPHRTGPQVTRAGEGATLWTGEHGGRGVLVAGTEPPDVLELWDWTLGPGDEHTSEPHTRGTTELVHVLEGEVEIRVGDERTVLATGDAMSFRSDVEHAYAHRGDGPARFALTVMEPGVGSRPGSRDPRG